MTVSIELLILWHSAWKKNYYRKTISTRRINLNIFQNAQKSLRRQWYYIIDQYVFGSLIIFKYSAISEEIFPLEMQFNAVFEAGRSGNILKKQHLEVKNIPVSCIRIKSVNYTICPHFRQFSILGRLNFGELFLLKICRTEMLGFNV